MNELFAAYGALEWKSLLTPLLLPPASLMALMAFGVWLRAARRPLTGAAVVALGFIGLWFSHCRVTGDWLEQRLLKPPAAIEAEDISSLRKTLRPGKVAVVVLGGGRDVYAPEYGDGVLSPRAHQRLHYGLWLSRRLDAPVLFSGGVGHGERSDVSEAAIAARIAERDYGRPLRWLESQSRDTRGNARLSLPILASHGIQDVLLVTHAWHMPRSMRAFEEAVTLSGMDLRLIAAPMDTAGSSARPALNWMPSPEGYQKVRDTLREAIGLLAGA